MKESLRTLLHSLIDYAGLFPPASLTMDRTVRNYATYRAKEEQWMLGRLIVPVSRFSELDVALTISSPSDVADWRLAALTGPDIERDLTLIDEFNRYAIGRPLIDVIETKASSVQEIEMLAQKLPVAMTCYVEIPPANPEPLLKSLSSMNLRAKLRTGGITPEAFPEAEVVAHFLMAACDAAVQMKATAGLHHPLRCIRPLTYEKDAVQGPMNGFINLFAAAALSYSAAIDDEATLTELLLDDDSFNFAFDDEELRWRDYAVSTEEIGDSRDDLAIAFGSCSIEEPIQDLTDLGWM